MVCSQEAVVVGSYVRPCEGEVVCKLEHRNVPYFNAFIYLENKTQIGKVEDIFGSITDAVREARHYCWRLLGEAKACLRLGLIEPL